GHDGRRRAAAHGDDARRRRRPVDRDRPVGTRRGGTAGRAVLTAPRPGPHRFPSRRPMTRPSTAPLPATLVVIPTYDERAALPGTPEGLRRAVPAAHVLVVDDASPDGTGEWAQEVSRTDPAVHVLHRPGKQGLGPAYLAGFAWGLEQGYEQLVEMDADAS